MGLAGGDGSGAGAALPDAPALSSPQAERVVAGLGSSCCTGAGATGAGATGAAPSSAELPTLLGLQ